MNNELESIRKEAVVI